MDTKFYIGAKEIMTVTMVEKKDTNAVEMVKVMFTDSSSVTIPKLKLELVQTEEPSDASSIQRIVRKQMGGLIYGLMHQYGLSVLETNDALDEAAQLVQNAMDKATNILFNVEYPADRTVNQINDILIEHANKNDNNDSAPAGSGTATEDSQ